MTAVADSRPFGRLASIPPPRRIPVALAVIASIGVFGTSLSALPLVVLFPVALAWLIAFAVGALAMKRGALLLTVLAALTKTVTVLMIVWMITSPHSALGPRTALDWSPLGLLNAGTGLWLLAVIRHSAR